MGDADPHGADADPPGAPGTQGKKALTWGEAAGGGRAGRGPRCSAGTAGPQAPCGSGLLRGRTVPGDHPSAAETLLPIRDVCEPSPSLLPGLGFASF